MLNLKHVTKDGGRPPIPQAIAATVKRYKDGHSCVGHVLPPRVGKSSIIRGAALELQTEGAPFVLCLCPWKNLADQLSDTEKTKAFIKHYGIVLDRPFASQSITKITDDEFYVREGGVPTLLSCTIGLAHHAAPANAGAEAPLIAAIHRAKAETGRSPVIIVDEIHVVGENKSWGNLVNRLMNAGAFIVTMTGTELRSDLDVMPGFEKAPSFEPTQSMKKATVVGKKVKDGQKFNILRPEIYTSDAFKVVPVGGVNVGWHVAFKNHWMLRTNVIKLDTVECINGDKQVALSDVPKSALGGMLSDILRDEKTIAKGAEVLLKRMKFWRERTGKKAQGLVITGSDRHDDSGDDYHARLCRRIIQDELSALGINGAMSGLRVEIATSNTDGDEKANDKIKAFAKGQIDILIVKMMGLVGLDVPECMVTLNLSTIRQGPIAKQANSRHLTPWTGVTDDAADLIVPWDALAQDMIAEFGADGGVVKTWALDEIGEEYDKPETEKQAVIRKTENALVSGYADEVGGAFDAGDSEAVLYAIKTKYIVRALTDPEILSNYAKGGYSITEEEIAAHKSSVAANAEVIDLTERANEKRGQFGKRAQRYANEITPYSQDPDGYRTAVINLQADAKKIARFRGNVADIDDPDLMERLMDALDQAYLDMAGHK